MNSSKAENVSGSALTPPLCVFAPLRLCVDLGPFGGLRRSLEENAKTQWRKGAKAGALSTWLTFVLIGLIFLASRPVLAQAPPTATPRATVDWLKVLVLEGRLELRSGATAGPRLFSEKVVDGRTWMEYIADTLGVAAGGDPAQPAVANE